MGAFLYLMNLAKKHPKLKFTWNQKKLEKQEYLNGVRFTTIDIQLLFALKTRMVDVKSNSKSNLYNIKKECQICDDKSVVENENHILHCENLKTEESVQIKFEDVYGTVEEQLNAVKIFRTILRKREILIELKEND